METVGQERRIGWIAPLAYLLMAAAAVVAFLVIRQVGEQMAPAVATLPVPEIDASAIFGGFLLGAMFPHSNRLAIAVREKIESLVTTLFLPAFFAFTGMRTELGLVSGWENWLWCGLMIVVATLGKLGGTVVAARLHGIPPHEATSLGILMNTRGLMELVVLNIGLELRIISPTVFAMMVVMALATTLATTPALHLLERKLPGKSLATLQQS